MELIDLLLFDQIIEDVRDAEEHANEPQRELNQTRIASHLSDQKSMKYSRVSKEPTREIMRIPRTFIKPPTRASAHSVETEILVALRFFGYGSYQEMTGTNIYTAVSQPSVSRCIREVCEAFLHPEISNTWVHFPRNIREMESSRTRFYRKFNFPGIVGAIDCTHVAIGPPRGDPGKPKHVYVNRKSYHPIEEDTGSIQPKNKL